MFPFLSWLHLVPYHSLLRLGAFDDNWLHYLCVWLSPSPVLSNGTGTALRCHRGHHQWDPDSVHHQRAAPGGLTTGTEDPRTGLWGWGVFKDTLLCVIGQLVALVLFCSERFTSRYAVITTLDIKLLYTYLCINGVLTLVTLYHHCCNKVLIFQLCKLFTM